MGMGESTLIYGSFEARITLGKSVALLKSSIEPSTISFLCPPPSYQFILSSNVHYEHVMVIECQVRDYSEVVGL
jgi:hypothetical protein